MYIGVSKSLLLEVDLFGDSRWFRFCSLAVFKPNITRPIDFVVGRHIE